MATRAQGGSGMLGRQQLASMLGEVSRGDRAAFARLYEASSRKLYAIVLGIARRRELADDLLQEATFVSGKMRRSSTHYGAPR